MSNQLRVPKMTTTLFVYGHWLKKGDRRHIEQMESIRARVPRELPKAHDNAQFPPDPATLNDDS